VAVTTGGGYYDADTNNRVRRQVTVARALAAAGHLYHMLFLDASIFVVLFGAGAGFALRGSALLGAALVLVALAWLRGSSAPAAWLSKAHLAQHATAAASRATSLRHKRHVGHALPCPYPDAWYAVALSPNLPPGAVLDATVCGRALVVWRPASGGMPSVLDAYCPHNGAHLAHGSTVDDGGAVGDCLRCPFHGWKFDRTGKVVSVPGGDRVPETARARAWPVRERNGVISVWMSAAGHGGAGAAGAGAGAAVASGAGACALDAPHSRPPPPPPSSLDASALDAAAAAASPPAADSPWFEIPVFSDIDGPAPAFAFHGFSEHVVPALIYELPENGADIAHLTELHTAFVAAPLRPLFAHAWEGTWAPSADAATPHLADMRVVEHTTLLGARLPAPVRVRITQAGPSQVYLEFAIPALGRVTIVETVTPVAPTQQRVLHALHAEPRVPRPLAKAILWSVVQAYEQDVPVWAHKRYEPRPLLTAKDAPVATFRRWTKQFYRDPKAITFEQAQRAHVAHVMGLDSMKAALDW
jgi:nitrite reductase/ring-hydroxylating ferredoxin subunit